MNIIVSNINRELKIFFYKISMKLLLNLSLFLLAFTVLEGKSFSLTDYKIREICKKEREELTCIKNLKEKRSNLQKGNLIEIPVIPYRGNKNLNFKF